VLDSYQRVDTVLAAFAAGEIVVVTDDDDRENEGDLFVAASLCTPEKMAFIIRHTSGIVCAPLSAEEAKRLHLDPMVAANDAPLGTAFTVSVDVRHGLTTGISAEERTNTVRALANGNAGATDFVRPGHVFPLVAKDGGVLMRSGHTEACVDLCRLAGLSPVGVLAELMNDDGTVTRGAPQASADFDRRSHCLPADARQARQAHRRISGAEQDRHARGLRLCDAVRRHPAYGLRLRSHRRRQGHAGAAASRRHHPRRLWRRQSGPLRPGAVQTGRPRRHRVPA
jgi:3,4-dihydroxy-2-butanone 4-phosphate synthase